MSPNVVPNRGGGGGGRIAFHVQATSSTSRRLVPRPELVFPALQAFGLRPPAFGLRPPASGLRPPASGRLAAWPPAWPSASGLRPQHLHFERRYQVLNTFTAYRGRVLLQNLDDLHAENASGQMPVSTPRSHVKVITRCLTIGATHMGDSVS